MAEFWSYISNQQKISREAIRNSQLAEKLSRNIQQTNSPNDNDLRICNSNKRISCYNPIIPEKSSDPVYRKIGEAIKEIHKPPFAFYNIESSLALYANDLLIKIENRQMPQSEYEFLQNTPMKTLITKWASEIKGRINKTA